MECCAPCKPWTQHCWQTTPNIVVCYMLRPFAHPVACCCMLLRIVRSCCAKFESGQTFSYVKNRPSKSQQCWELLRPFARSLTLFGTPANTYATTHNNDGTFLRPFSRSLSYVQTNATLLASNFQYC